MAVSEEPHSAQSRGRIGDVSAEMGSPGWYCVAHHEYASIEIVPKAGNRCSDAQAASEAAQPCTHPSRILSLGKSRVRRENRG
jgi:hypothetical protein